MAPRGAGPLVLGSVMLVGLLGSATGFVVPGRLPGAGVAARQERTALSFFGGKKAKVAPAAAPPRVISPDFRLALSTGGASLLLFQGALYPVAVIHFLLTALLGVQTTRVRFLLDAEAFEVVLNAGDGGTKKGGENIVVGGENRWKYDTFTNWKFFPSEAVPILVYFKETQTKPEGQIHFFPVVCNGQELLQEMLDREIPRLPEGSG